MALCDRLEAEQADAAEAHARLVDALLATLTASRDAAECAANWQRLSEHFDTLFTTEASITALKQTVLQLAVMGRLVPQDPTDEPASELLKRIEAEKARLVKEGKIRKPKAAEPVGDDERGFKAPIGWIWCRLHDVFDVRDGTHDSPNYLPSGIPFLTSKNIYDGKLNLDGVKFISNDDHSKFSVRSKVDRYDILFAMIGSIGNPVIVDVDFDFSFKNMALFKYFSLDLSEPRYLRIFLSVSAAMMRNQAAGGVQSFISLSALRNFPLPLPPLPEQHRIVAKVDELMTLCDRLQADLATARDHRARLADTLVQTALEAA